MRRVHIYALHSTAEPGVYRYVGKTCDLAKRLKEHLGTSFNHNKGLKNWIANTKSILGQKLLCKVLKKTDKDHWQKWEKYWIKKLRQGGHPLLNLHEGGTGGDAGWKHGPGAKKRSSEASLRFWNNPDNKARMRTVKKRLWENSAFRAKMISSYIRAQNDPALKKKMSIIKKRLWANPVHRRKIISGIIRAGDDPAVRARRSAAMKRVSANPTVRARRLVVWKLLNADPDFTTKRLAACRRAWAKKRARREENRI
jgi:hypothetical protein